MWEIARSLVVVGLVVSSFVMAADYQYLVRTDRLDYKPGDKIRVAVRLDNPDSFRYGSAVLWGNLANLGETPFALNKETGLLESVITVPEILNTKEPKLSVYLENSAGTRTVLEGGKDFDNPVIREAKIDGNLPEIKNVRTQPTEKGTLLVDFDVFDESALRYGSAVIWSEGSNRGESPMKCAGTKPAKCSVEIPLTKSVAGQPELSIYVEDVARNRANLSSKNDFQVDWSKIKLQEDKGILQISDVSVTACSEKTVRVRMRVSGTKLEYGSVVIWGNSANLSESPFVCNDKGICEATLKLPEIMNTKSPRISIYAEGTNGKRVDKEIPASAIDFKGIPVDERSCRVTYVGVENPLLRHEEYRKKMEEPSTHRK